MAMRDHLLFIGVPPANIHVRTLLPPVDWEQHHRIELLADMRNAGMKPFYDTLPAGLSSDGKPWTGIIWYNDVYLSASHFLEIMHQHMSQGADMTCGWDHAGKWFYDGWVGRDMAGDLYTPFPVREEDQDLPQKVSSSRVWVGATSGWSNWGSGRTPECRLATGYTRSTTVVAFLERIRGASHGYPSRTLVAPAPASSLVS